MTVRSYFLNVVLGTCISGGSLVAVMTLIDPAQGGVVGIVLFFLSLFLTMMGVGTALMMRIWCYNQQCDHNHQRLLRAFRHGTWIAIAVVLLVLLRWENFFTWWMALFAIGVVIMMELYVIIIRQRF